MEIKNLLYLAVGALFLGGAAIGQELTDFSTKLAYNESGALTATEGKEEWQLLPQGPNDTLDLRVMGINGNTMRGQTNTPLYATLASHILVVVDRQMANEVYRRDNCEAKAAEHVRGIFVLPASSAVYRSLQMKKMASSLPGTESRTCATLKGRYFGMTHFTSEGHNWDSEFTTMKMSAGLPGLDGKTTFVAEEINWLPCER